MKKVGDSTPRQGSEKLQPSGGRSQSGRYNEPPRLIEV